MTFANSDSNWSANRPVVSQKSRDASTRCRISLESKTLPDTGTADSPGDELPVREGDGVVVLDQIKDLPPEFVGRLLRPSSDPRIAHSSTAGLTDTEQLLICRQLAERRGTKIGTLVLRPVPVECPIDRIGDPKEWPPRQIRAGTRRVKAKRPSFVGMRPRRRNARMRRDPTGQPAGRPRAGPARPHPSRVRSCRRPQQCPDQSRDAPPDARYPASGSSTNCQGRVASGLRISTGSPQMKASTASGTSRSAARSPPPITLPARAVANPTRAILGAGEERSPIRRSDVLLAGLACRVRVGSAERLILPIGPNPFTVSVALVARDGDHCPKIGPVPQRLEKMDRAEHVRLECLRRVGIGSPHQRLSGEVEDDLRIRFGNGVANCRRIAHVAEDGTHSFPDASLGEDTPFALGRKRESGHLSSVLLQPER